MKKSTALSVLYALFLTATLLLFGYAVKKGAWLETDLRALLPQEQGWTAVQVRADEQQEARLNQQVISLVGHSSPQKAFQLAEQTAQQWQKIGLFARVDAKTQPDLDALRAEIARLRLATLPPSIRYQLLHAPQNYFQHYAEQIMNPFAQTNLLPLDQDWLGFGRFVLPQAQRLARFYCPSGVKTDRTFLRYRVNLGNVRHLAFLPALFRRYQNKPRTPNPKVRWILDAFFTRRMGAVSILLGGIFIGVGLYRSEWRDDIRQWVSMPQAMLDEAKQIGDLTGVELGNRYFLVLADNDDALLEKERALTAKLDEQHIPYRALSQWIMSEAQQRQFAAELNATLKPQNYAILDEIGVPSEKLQQALRELNAQSPLSLQQALQSTIGQAWLPLYLGKLAENQVAGIVQVSGHSAVSLAHLANQQDIFWQDKRAHLNQAFQQTRDQAAWLKMLSFVFAGVLLWPLFGVKRTFTMLLPPLCAIVITVAIFGWFGLPISLFTMFGLLLVSAIGIDYTAYMQTANEPLYGKYIAVLLAAMTTLISFVLLGLSSTPAVASFGLSVSLGVLLSVILTFKLLR